MEGNGGWRCKVNSNRLRLSSLEGELSWIAIDWKLCACFGRMIVNRSELDGLVGGIFHSMR